MLTQESLIFLFLPENAGNCLLVSSLCFIALLRRRLSKRSKPSLSFAYILSQNVVNVIILLLLLSLEVLRPPVLQDQLQLCLLVFRELISIL